MNPKWSSLSLSYVPPFISDETGLFILKMEEILSNLGTMTAFGTKFPIPEGELIKSAKEGYIRYYQDQAI